MNNDLISRSALLEELSKGTIITDDMYSEGIMAGVDYAIKKIEAAPAVDAVEVVRCKDCKCGKYPDSTKLVGKYVNCALYDPMPLMRSDDFCSYGERRADE